MSKEMLDGVGLLKLARFPNTMIAVEEIYVVAFRGHVVPARFTSYADATVHYEKLLCLGASHPGVHAKTILALPGAQVREDVA